MSVHISGGDPRTECGNCEADFQAGSGLTERWGERIRAGEMYAVSGETCVKRLDFVSKKRDFGQWESFIFHSFS